MNRIKELREERKLSFRTMEISSGINFMNINRYENGSRDMSTEILKKLSDYFEVTIDYLSGYSDYCLYALYELGNYRVKIDGTNYKKYKELDCIYFNSANKRCIDINKLAGINNDLNISYCIDYGNIINNLNCMLKKPSSDKPVNSTDSIPDFNDQILSFIKGITK